MAQVNLKSVTVKFPVLSSSEMNLKRRIVSTLWGKQSEPALITALNDVNLKVENGDRIGLRGPNGAGKSTLLRVIAGALPPTSGSVEIVGRSIALIDQGLGFDQNCTGRENIYRRAIYCGMSRATIEPYVSDIISFSELALRIDHPISTYSSGMKARLAFSISTALKADILVIDEGIGMADRAFLDKAHQRLADFYQSRKILILATHDENLLNTFCSSVYSLSNGLLSKDC